MIVAENSDYAWFFNNYAIYIKSGFDDQQKDYYKECTNVALWFNRIKGNQIRLIFFKNTDDYNYIMENCSIAWRITVHYQFCRIIRYPKGATKEFITDLIVKVLMDIYKNGNIRKC